MIEIPVHVKTLLDILQKNKYEAYIVGGCVRDSIIGTIPYDWDICTNANPEQILSCFGEYKTIQNGKKHGTIGVILENKVYEITTYRLEGKYLDSRRPSEVFFTDSLQNDLSRRDFTINALAYNEKDGLKDFFDGIEDINIKNIRCVGDANIRFNEDALRILRALRLSSCLGFKIEKNTSEAMIDNRLLLNNIAIERTNTEFSKLILGQDASMVLRQYVEIIKVFLPELSFIVDNSDDELWENTLRAIEMSLPDIIIRLFFLFKDIPEFEKVLKRLKYENKIIFEVCALINNYKIEICSDFQSIKKLLNLLGEKMFRQILLIKCIDNLLKGQSLDVTLDIEENLNQIITEKQCFKLEDLKVDGDDLKSLGIKEGKKTGEVLSKLLDIVINDETENKKDKLLKLARQMI